MKDELELEVFRAGDYGPRGRWSEEDMDGIIADYDPALHEAPVTLDHAQTGPALGWVTGVRRSGDRMICRLRQVHEGLIDLLKQGAFRKRSVEIYGLLPETGRPYLKAVSFLGAAAPAVKGLRDLVFQENPGDGEPASREADFSSFDWPEIGADEPAFGDIERELRASGRWQPGWEDRGIAEFYSGLGGGEVLEFAEGNAVSPTQWFANFLKSLPAYLPMGEAAPGNVHAFSDSVPAGANVSPASIALHRRAVMLRQAHPEMDYARALLISVKS